MKSLLLIPSIIMASGCTPETIIASKEITTREYSFASYSAIEIHDNFNVYLSFSESEEKFKVRANENLHSYIKTTQVGNKVIVKLDDVHRIMGNETLNIYITTKAINDIKIDGNTHISVADLVSSSNVKLELMGNCSIIGSVNVEQMDLMATANCMVDLSGNIGTLNAKVVANSDLSDYCLTIGDLNIDLSGNSNAHLTVINTITIEASGNSILYYKGNPTIRRQNLTSNAKIIKV